MKKPAIILAAALALVPKGNFAHTAQIQDATQKQIIITFDDQQTQDKNTFTDKQPNSIDHQTIISMNMSDILTQYGETQGMEMIRQHFLEEINSLRTNNALPILHLDALLNNAAQDHAEDVVKNNYFLRINNLHINKKWEDWKIRIKNTWYRTHEKNIKTGEIISKWPLTIKNILASFMDSATHKNQILDPNYFDMWVWEKDWIIVICFGWSYVNRYK